jgi:hypothetical protein
MRSSFSLITGAPIEMGRIPAAPLLFACGFRFFG